jgi:Arc/MetJ-type ribon-helix-helix transcriptional regulator
MSPVAHAPAGEIRKTSFRLPEELLDAVARAVERGEVESQTAFVERALRHELASLRRSELREAYAAAARDERFREEAETLGREFDPAVGDGLS